VPVDQSNFTVREIAFDDKGGADRDFGNALDSFDLNDTPAPGSTRAAGLTPRSMAAVMRAEGTGAPPTPPTPVKRRSWLARFFACLFGGRG
jgi:hypothetical protein